MTHNRSGIENKIIRVAMLAEYPFEEEDLLRGGVIQANYRLIQALGKLDGIEIFVLMPSLKTTAITKRRDGNVTVIFFPLRNKGYGSLLWYPGIRQSYKSILAGIKPDLLHAQAAPAYMLAALEGNVPSVITIHGIFRNELPLIKSRQSLRERLVAQTVIRIQEECFRKAKHVIAITREIESLVKTFSADARIYKIDNAIDERFFSLQNHDSEPTILFIGWINNRKGVHILLEAFSRIVHAVPGVRLRLVGQADGDTEYGARLKTTYQSLISSGNIEFIGSVSQEKLYEKMSQCSLLCLPSFAESAPMVIAQAMAAGKPVVATRIGGIPEMVEEGVTGLLCAPGNPDELAGHLLTLLHDSQLRRAMGQKATYLAEKRYRASAVAKSTLAAYQQILCLR